MYFDRQFGNLVEPLGGRSWSRADITRRIQRRVAWYRDFGLHRHDRVFLHYGNALEFFVDLLAIWNVGACAVPVDARLTAYEIGKLAEATRPRLSIWAESPGADIATALRALDVDTATLGRADKEQASASRTCGDEPVMLDDDALILFTSGTTGQPKAVVHTHRSLRARWSSLLQALGTRAYRRTLCLLPTHFGHGLICNCLFPWLAGQDLYILPPYRPDVLLQLGSIIDEHRITFMSSVPPVWRLAAKTARPPGSGSLERVFCGSAPLSATLWQAVRDWTGTPNVFNAYGITETGSWLAGSIEADRQPEDGFIGKAWGGVLRVLKEGTTDRPPWEIEECRPDESGYVWINTPALMKGYLGQDDVTAGVVSHGWFVTGDIGVIDADGNLYLRGREREEINKGGAKIYPGDVDTVAEQFEGVTDVCTFAFADPLQGEDVGIAIVMESATDSEMLRLYDWMSERLAKHKLPVRWYLIEEIPRTSRGKINRESVSEVCAALTPFKLRNLLKTRRDSDDR